jgi:glycosyltransferase involved in cell wall biosynthesis
MKILFQYLSSSSGGGGALSNVIMLLKALARIYSDDHIFILCFPSSKLTELGMLSNVTILPFGNERHKELYRLVLGMAGLRKIAHEKGVDISWSLNLGSYVGTGRPAVLSVHNPHQAYPLDVTRLHPRGALGVAALRWFFRRSLKHADAIFGQTRIMVDHVSRSMTRPIPTYVVPKAVENPLEIAAEPLPPRVQALLGSDATRPFTFLYVATYSPHKNHALLCEIFDRLKHEAVNARVVVTLSTAELERIGGECARDLIDRGYIVPIGWTEKKHVKSLYDEADACLMPSLLESLSSSHLEAMQWRKPQIVADLPYALDLCASAAIYADPDDAGAWVDAIKALIGDPECRRRLVELGIARMAVFPASWDECARMIRAALEETVARFHDGNSRIGVP